jgi:spermidine/putrescine transport system ATP-binding protein
MEEMKDLAVELVDVVKRFPNPGGGIVTAVDHLSLEIRNGEFFSLLGPSGCGKTTSLRMIGGFEWPTGGEILIQGQPTGKTPPYVRPVNTVFQSYALFQHMTIFQNVAFGLEMEHIPHSEIKHRVGEALEMVQLRGYDQRKPRQLSGGQQQRVALARALVKRPAVLLLDEPLGALDLKLRKDMQLELKALQAQVGITFIYVTHDQEEALTMSDRIAVMNQGKVLQVGSPFEIYEQPTSRFVADFIGETNLIKARVIRLNGSTTTVRLEDSGVDVVGMCRGEVVESQPVEVSIRPEKIQISLEKGPRGVSIPGRVEASAYAGSDTRLMVRIGSQTRIMVWEPNRTAVVDSRQLYNAGQDVWLTILPENTLILYDE